MIKNIDKDTSLHHYGYNAMGTTWGITIWDTLDDIFWKEIQSHIKKESDQFEELYSRFKETSLVTRLSKSVGIYEVPKDLVSMISLYKRFYALSDKKFNPCVGGILEDLGYDKEYTLTPQKNIRSVPDLDTAIEIIDATHIHLHEKVLLDFGALGKGYFVDVIAEYLKSKNISRFLVDGSGDVYYQGNNIPISVGLEHPGNTSLVIGVMSMHEGAMCSSATNRRRWSDYNHYVDPHSLTSPEEIIAVWVTTQETKHADLLTSLLFFVDPEKITEIPFEYCIVNKDYKVKRSAGFVAELF